MFRNLLVITFVIVLFSGCYSEKILRTKPTTFLDMQEKISDGKLKYHCVNFDEKAYTEIEILKQNICEGYITVSAQDVKEVYKNNLETMVNDLFYISDMNCRKYVERFKFNYIKQDVTGKFLNLNIFGLGFNIGTIGDLANEQFVRLSDTLNSNLNKRAEIKKSIISKVGKGSKDSTINEILVDFIEYDRSCSLVTTF
ncbi:hypothetical protein CRV08_08400 [Halarcobacter ebronensis]|uniref:Lipoprotein n=1 Tax=Halarcobacter ebronensis TaxID=1462615 RepID=A0A4Q0YCY1_9BACT|nr:hypothetical protein [Halarcobacter ebronensis]RXJ68262.1 hypothetical protein CRV08_08400 [Halarcobacter ebronensis]